MQKQILLFSAIILPLTIIFPGKVAADAIKVDEIIYFASLEYEVDPFLIRAVIKTESNFDPFAVSPQGAMGLMQLMPGTAQQLGVSNPFDLTQNIYGGTKHIRDLLQRYKGDIVLALAAYNAGSARIKDRVPTCPETRKYIERVKRHYKCFLLN